MKPKYPVYIISKGRADCCLTARELIKDHVPFRLVIEPQEKSAYAQYFDESILLELPFSNLGLGSIPARNWVWEHAKQTNAERHWTLDDNIRGFFYRYKAKRNYCNAGIALSALEDFVDQFSNVSIAGLNYSMFCPDGQKLKPYFLNVHVYSCILIRNADSFRWRGRYNEDTDLCLQALSAGFCTVLLNVFTCIKMRTLTMKGGNMESLYQGDGRLKMAKSLQRMWPYVVHVKRRFNRPQHHIKSSWKYFTTPLKPRSEIGNTKPQQAYRLKLVSTRENNST